MWTECRITGALMERSYTMLQVYCRYNVMPERSAVTRLRLRYYYYYYYRHYYYSACGAQSRLNCDGVSENKTTSATRVIRCTLTFASEST